MRILKNLILKIKKLWKSSNLSSSQKRSLIFLMILFLCGAGILSFRNRPHYGNDRESVIKTISSIDTRKNTDVELLNTYDIGNTRFVSFLSNTSVGVAQFKKDEKGDYLYKSHDISHSKNIMHFALKLDEGEGIVVVTVKNHLCNIRELVLKVNNTTYNLVFRGLNSNSLFTKIKEPLNKKYSISSYYQKQFPDY